MLMSGCIYSPTPPHMLGPLEKITEWKKSSTSHITYIFKVAESPSKTNSHVPHPHLRGCSGRRELHSLHAIVRYMLCQLDLPHSSPRTTAGAHGLIASLSFQEGKRGLEVVQIWAKHILFHLILPSPQSIYSIWRTWALDIESLLHQ